MARDDLLRMNNKLLAELNMKNKIIYDLKTKENWLAAEIVSMKRSNARQEGAVNGTGGAANGIVNGVVDETDHTEAMEDFVARNAEMEDMKMKLFQTLLHFKKEIAKAQATVEQNANLTREADRKRAAAEEQAAYLQSVLTSLNNNEPPDSVAALDRKHIQELEAQLKAADNEVATLQSKVALWSRASKRNQEARIQAEACQKQAENDLANLRDQLATLRESETTLKTRCEELDQKARAFESATSTSPQASAAAMVELKQKVSDMEGIISDRDTQIRAHELALETARTRLKEFEDTIQEASVMMDELEKENSALRTDLRGKESKFAETERKLAATDSEFAAMVERYDALKREHEESTVQWGRQVDVLGAAHRTAEDGKREVTVELEGVKTKLAMASEAIAALAKREQERDEKDVEVGAALMKKDERIKEIEEEVLEKDARIKEVEAEVAKRDERFKEVEAEVAKRDERIKEIEAEVATKDQHIKEIEAEGVKKDDRIKEVETELAKQEGRIKELEKEIEIVKTKLSETEANLTKTRELHSLESSQQVAEQTQRISELEQDLATLRSQTVADQQDLLSLREERDKLQKSGQEALRTAEEVVGELEQLKSRSAAKEAEEAEGGEILKAKIAALEKEVADKEAAVAELSGEVAKRAQEAVAQSEVIEKLGE
ncbi:hypothetical protein HK104_005326, partial [Borealophlyctis nickersoniae]